MVSEASGPWIENEHPWYDLSRFVETQSPPEQNFNCSDNKDNFVYWEKAKSAMGDFCRDTSRLSIQASGGELNKGKVINAHYNNGVYDEMDLRFTWYQNDRIDEKGCIQFFNDIVDKCDVDQQDKHGGSYTYMKSGNANKILVAEIIPSGSLRKGDTLCALKVTDIAPKDVVNAAIEKWCSDVDGWDLGSARDKEHYQRFSIDKLGVPDRASFWLQATMLDENTCPEGTIRKDQCMQALRDGMDFCDPNSENTYGHMTTSGNCVKYRIVASGITTDGGSPWAVDPHFPPSEFELGTGGQPLYPECIDTLPDGRPVALGRSVSNEELEKAIDGFCQDGAEIKGFGEYGEFMYDFPPAGTPQFYNDDSVHMHVNMGAQTVNNGGPPPYKNMDWCK
jgi:hypothetical protein